MKKKIYRDYRGFTLIELIIAISIFSIVIAMGYSIINKYNKTIGEQQNTTEVQMAINTINKYVTKDLEKSSGITLKTIYPNEGIEYSVTNGQEGKEEYLKNSLIDIQQRYKIDSNIYENKLIYKYVIDLSNNSKSPEYTVELKYRNDSSYITCSISRSIENESNLELLSNHKIKKTSDIFDIPFSINSNNPYKVSIALEEKINKLNTYSFDVASRYTVAKMNDNEIKPPTITIPKGYNSVGFWVADKTKLKDNNLLTWVNGSKKENQVPDYVSGEYASQKQDKEDIFKFSAVNSENGNSGHTSSSIGYERDYGNKTESSVNKADTLKPNKIEKIYIYVSKNMTVYGLKDRKKLIQGVVGENGSLENLKLNGGNDGKIYEFILDQTKFKYFDISGVLSIDTDNNGEKKVDSGYALIMYGKGDSQYILQDDPIGTLSFEYIYKGNRWGLNVGLNINGKEKYKSVSKSRIAPIKNNIKINGNKIQVNKEKKYFAELEDSTVEQITGLKFSLDEGINNITVKFESGRIEIINRSNKDIIRVDKDELLNIDIDVDIGKLDNNKPASIKIEFIN